MALAHLPLLARLATRLWAAEHYQFFPLLLLGAGYLGYLRAKQADPSAVGRSGVRLGMVLFAVGLLALAVAIDSAWLAGISAMFSLLMAVYFYGGRDLLAKVMPVWFVLWLMVPLPLKMDEQLIFSMQQIATRWASGVLDLIGIRHLVSGVVIEMRGHEFLIEEACSGIHSFFATMACTLFVLVLSHRRWFRWLLLLIAAVFWVLVANAVRVVAVTVLGSRWDLPVTEGLGHDIAGALVFLLAMGLVLSTDRLFLFLLPERRYDASSDPARRRGKRWLGIFKFGRGRKNRETDEMTADTTRKASEPRTKRRRFTQVARWEHLTLIAVFGVVGFAQFVPRASSMPRRDAVGSRFFGPQTVTDMPAEIGDWQRVSFETIVRTPDDPLSYISHIWHYRRDTTNAQLSLEGPYYEWHDVGYCLKGSGWETEEGRHRSYSEIGESLAGGFTELELSKGLNQFGFVLFAGFDDQHNPVMPKRRLFQRLLPIRETIGVDDGRLASPDSEKYQIVMFVESPLRLSAAEQDAARELFHEARRLVTGRQSAWVEVDDVLVPSRLRDVGMEQGN